MSAEDGCPWAEREREPKEPNEGDRSAGRSRGPADRDPDDRDRQAAEANISARRAIKVVAGP